MSVSEIAKRANSAALVLSHLSTDVKNQVLKEMANVLEENCDAILSANEKDLHDIIASEETEIVVAGMVGVAGLEPVLTSIINGKNQNSLRRLRHPSCWRRNGWYWSHF